jgi:diamine N-acetyltransferase
MHPQPILRQATPADAALLAGFGAKSFYDAFAAQNNPEDLALYLATAFTPQKLLEELADTQATFVLAEIEGELAGYAKLQLGTTPECIRHPNTIEIARLYAGQAWIGRGIGAALMEYCITHAYEIGRGSIWLGVWELNPCAQRFYRKWNFEPVGKHIFWVGNDPQNDIVMERALP